MTVTLPSTFLPLLTRVYEVVCKGQGSSRTITAGTFRARSYEGQPADNSHKEALLAPLVRAVVESGADVAGTQEFSDRAQYDCRNLTV